MEVELYDDATVYRGSAVCSTDGRLQSASFAGSNDMHMSVTYSSGDYRYSVYGVADEHAKSLSLLTDFVETFSVAPPSAE